jgi:type II secretory pathway pseudopilin PulG
MAIIALALPAMMGAGALAVDVGHMYVAKSVMQTAMDAGARAGAAVLAEGGTQADAEAEARSFIDQNISGVPYLAGAVSTVSFPAATSIQVDISHPLDLFFASFVGLDTATIAAGAGAEVAAIRSIEPGNLVPFGIYCNNDGGCGGQLSVDQTFTDMLRHCGNVFGAGGSSCNYSPDTPSDSEIFLTGLSFNNNNSNGELKDEVENGYSGTAEIGQIVGALTGTRQGWQSSMRSRLNAGNNEMTFPVIAPTSANDGTVQIIDFVQVRIDDFQAGSASRQDEFDFQIIPRAVSSTDFTTGSEGLDINSILGVRLSS